MSQAVTVDQKAEWISRVLGFDFRAGAAAPGEVPGIADWRAARSTAIASLKALENAFRRMDEPEAAPAIILLRAIQANLTETPSTQRQVDELIRYIEQDDVIEEAEQPNNFGFTVTLRQPLRAALAKMKPRS